MELGIHSLRHSFATHLLEKGVNIKYIKHLAGNQITNETFVAKSGFSWRSWGEQITILHDKNKIPFSSICDPDNRPSVASFGMNKVNRKTSEKSLA